MSVTEEDILRALGPKLKLKLKTKQAAEASPESKPAEQPVAPMAAAPVSKVTAPATPVPFNLNFAGDELVRGVLYAEILGKPRSKSRRRW